MSILLLHPGEMGSAVGACLRTAGHDVAWVSGGRSASTSERASEADLKEVASLGEGAVAAEFVISICPPHAAVEVAREVSGIGLAGTYVDANAVSPETSRQIQSIVEAGGGSYVDGGIIGPAPLKPGTTRLYLCGEEAGRVGQLFDGTHLEPRLMDAPVAAASALKMSYAAWTKGTTALLDAVLAVAEAEGVADYLRNEWAVSQPSLLERAERAAASADRAWRWAVEMEEIADTFRSAGLPDGFHRAAAEIFQRLAVFKDVDGVSVEEVVSALSDGEQTV